MSMKNFGAVLDFAIQMENEDASCLQQAVENPECEDCTDILKRLEKENRKNAKRLTRARQENVTEMILEPIQGLEEENFRIQRQDLRKISRQEALDKLKQLEDAAHRFYQEAAERIRPVSDVAGTFQRLAKKRKERAKQILSLH